MTSRRVRPRSRAAAWAAMLALPTIGCASARARSPVAVQVPVGRATRPDLLDKVPRILDRQGYQVAESQDTGNLIQYVTSWVTREPFEDESDRGAAECRTRLTLQARQEAGETFTVSLRAENLAHRSTLDEEWVAMAPTAMFRDHLREIADALALEIDMGVRTR